MNNYCLSFTLALFYTHFRSGRQTHTHTHTSPR